MKARQPECVLSGFRSRICPFHVMAALGAAIVRLCARSLSRRPAVERNLRTRSLQDTLSIKLSPDDGLALRLGAGRNNVHDCVVLAFQRAQEVWKHGGRLLLGVMEQYDTPAYCI